jgi:hypothetical protein
LLKLALMEPSPTLSLKFLRDLTMHPRSQLALSWGLTYLSFVLLFGAMTRWTIKPLCLSVLAGLLFLIALILVLPQVDLPDTAFHRGTAPVDVHSRGTSGPGLLSVDAAVPSSFSAQTVSRRREHALAFTYALSGSLPLLHRSLRC